MEQRSQFRPDPHKTHAGGNFQPKNEKGSLAVYKSSRSLGFQNPVKSDFLERRKHLKPWKPKRVGRKSVDPAVIAESSDIARAALVASDKRAQARVQARLRSYGGPDADTVLRSAVALNSIRALSSNRAQPLAARVMAKRMLSSMEFSNSGVSKVFKFKRTIFDNGIFNNAAAGAISALSRNFQLDQLPAFAEIAALFDLYRFKRITGHFFPRQTVLDRAGAVAVSASVCPSVAITSDPDDDTAPATLDDVLAYSNAEFFPGYERFHYTFKPSCDAAIEDTAGTVGRGLFDGWLDTATDDVEWFSLKWVVTSAGATAAASTFVWDAFFSVELEVKFVH